MVDKPGKLDMLSAMGADHVVDYLTEDFTRSGKCYDLILDVKTNRSPSAYLRALNANGAYVTVGGSIPRLLQALVMSPLTSRLYHKHVRLVGLRPNKDLNYMNELFVAGKLRPVIDGPYTLANLPEAFRLLWYRRP